MIRAAVLFLASTALLALPVSAAPRFATIRVAEIYRNLESTRTLNNQLDKERKDIALDERAIHLRKILEELSTLYKELQKKREAPVDEVTRKLAQSFEQKRQESQTLQQEFQLFETEKKKDINRRMVLAMRESLKKISSVSERIAKEQGYDCAFDVSGNSNTGVPVILYVKNGKDITEDVVAALKDSGEPTALPATAEPSPGTPAATPPAGEVPQAPAPAPAKP